MLYKFVFIEHFIFKKYLIYTALSLYILGIFGSNTYFVSSDIFLTGFILISIFSRELWKLSKGIKAVFAPASKPAYNFSKTPPTGSIFPFIEISPVNIMSVGIGMLNTAE